MDQRTISKRVQNIQREIIRLGNVVSVLGAADLLKDPDTYEVLSYEAALRSEKVTCALRNVLFNGLDVPKREYLSYAGEQHNIQIFDQEGIVQISFGALLAKKDRRGNNAFLLDPLRRALQAYHQTHGTSRFRACTICICQIYCDQLPEVRIRDFDNIERKDVIDTISPFFLTDDSGQYCDFHMTCTTGPNNATEIFLMDSERFPEWLAKRSKSL